MDLQEFKIIPILGRKTDVSADHPSLFQFIGDNVALTHDTGGVNFDLSRERGACTKSQGYAEWSNSANASATKCLGLFELYDGTNRNYIYFDNGNCYVYDGSLDPVEKEDSGSTAFATDNIDLYSIIRIGAYMVFTDRGEHTPYKWKHGDANLSKLCASGTEYKFRWLVSFARRVIGLYSDQTDGDIDIRYSTAWPTTAITSLNFPAANQLWVPNDQPLVGGATMGTDRCFLYCENSIQQLVYYQDYSAPFRAYTVVPHQGAVNHHSIISLGDRHYVFNKNYGFCEYRGGTEFPFGKPISDNIEPDIATINPTYQNLIVGAHNPARREVVWTVPLNSSTTPTHLFHFNLDSKQWTIEDRPMRYLDFWNLLSTFTWNDLIAALGGTGALWSYAGSSAFAEYVSALDRLVYSNTDGKLYYHIGEGLNGSNINGYRIEPILDFGNAKREDLLQEIWFNLGRVGDYSIDIYYRSGNTVGEVTDSTWTNIGSLSHNSPSMPMIRVHDSTFARLHQIKWGTDLKNETFQVGDISFRYTPGTEF